MKKNMLILLLLIVITNICSGENSPLDGWYWGKKIFGRPEGTTIKGKHFEYVKDSYNEKDGFALVLGKKIHYWLYDTITYHDGKADEIYNNYVPNWVEKMGYVIDFDNIVVLNPNSYLASSVKALMEQRNCDVSITLMK